jgi:uncharacterized protein (TIGR02147 family)
MSARQDSNSKSNKPDIVNYRDYRKYISDLFLFRKGSQPKLSLAFCARKLKTSAPYLKHVMAGRRHISLEKIYGITHLFALDPFETRCFVYLFLSQVTKNKELKQYFLGTASVLSAQKSILPSGVHPLAKENLQTNQKSWLHTALKGLPLIKGLETDPKWIQQHLIREVSLKEISEAWAELVKTGEVVQVGNNWEPIERDHTPNPNDLSTFQIYKVGLEQSAHVLDHLMDYMDAYFYMGSTPMNAQNFTKMGEAMARFAAELRSLSSEDGAPTSVMMFSLNLMKVTK